MNLVRSLLTSSVPQISPSSEPIQRLCNRIISLTSIYRYEAASAIYDSETDDNINFLREKVKGNPPSGEKIETYLLACKLRLDR